MAGTTTPSPLHRLRRVKAALLAVSLTLAGILLMMLSGWLDHLNLGSWSWLHSFLLTELAITDNLPSGRATQLTRSPAAAAGKVSSVNLDGWLLPKAGFSVTWALHDELPRDAEHREAV